jgi:hypothetical protein
MTTRIAVLTLIVAALLAGCGGSAQWAEFKPDGGGFAVQMPGTPKEESTDPVPTPAGDITMHLFTLEGGPIEYAVGYFDLPAELVGLAGEDILLSAGMEGFFGALGGSVTSESSITLAGFPGVEATGPYSSGGQSGAMKGRTYMVDARIFAAFAAQPNGDGNSPDIDKFLNSFRLTAAPAAQQPASPTEAVPAQSEQPAATSEPAAPPVVASGDVGLSRSNPAPRSQIVPAPNWDVQVVDVVRGDPAWQALAATNQFNDPAPEGMEYLLVRLRVKSTYADNEEHNIGSGDFDVTGDRLALYSSALAVAPDPELNADLRTGGETEGWVPYLVGQGEGNLMLVVNELANFDETRFRYIALDDGAALGMDPALGAIAPTDAGRDPGSPAARGETVVTEDWEITLLDVIRGDEAWAAVQAASSVNDPPAAGMEYILARVHARYIATAEATDSIDGFSFKSTGSAGVVYDTPIVVGLEPELEASLFPGGQAEGWIAVVVAEDEADVALVFEPLFDFGGENVRYISIEP